MNFDKRFRLPWNQQLEYICTDFRRRNNPKEWELFFSRQEFDDGNLVEEIAIEVIVSIEKFRNFSKEVLTAIEEKFHFTEDFSKYHLYVPLEFMEVYTNQLTKRKEFPPYEQLVPVEGFDNDQTWSYADDFIDIFRELYFHGVEKPEEFIDAIEKLKELNFSHPYTAFLQSDYYNMLGEPQQSMECVNQIEDCYFKFLQLGHIFRSVGDNQEALDMFNKAVQMAEGNLDPSLIEGIITSYIDMDMIDEALDVSMEFVENGYEHVAMPYVEAIVDGIFQSVMDMPQEEITEVDAIFVKEHYKIEENFQEVLKVCQFAEEQGYEHPSWQIDKMDALFECGYYEEAEKLAISLEENQEQLARPYQLKILQIQGKLAFEAGDVVTAYEIFDDIKDECKFDRRFAFALGKMYTKTEKVKEAYPILTRLAFYFKRIEYIYQLGRCYLLEKEGTEAAFYYLSRAYEMDPDYENVAYYLVKSAVDGGEYVTAREAYKDAKKHLSQPYQVLIEGFLMEMSDSKENVEKYYENALEEYNQSDFPAYVLDILCLRYLIIQCEKNLRLFVFERKCKKVLQTFEAGPETYTFIGSSLIGVDEYEKAYKYLHKALQMNQFDIQALKGISICAIELGMINEAEQYCDLLLTYTESDEAFQIAGYCLKTLSYGKMENGIQERMFELCKSGNQERALELVLSKIDEDAPAIYYKTGCELALYLGKLELIKKLIQDYERIHQDEFFEEDIERLKARYNVLKGSVLKAYGIASNMETIDGDKLAALISIMTGQWDESKGLYDELIAGDANYADDYIGAVFVVYIMGNEQYISLAQKRIDFFDKQYEFPEDYINPKMCCDYGYLNTLAGNFDRAREVLNYAFALKTCPEEYCHLCDEAHLGLGVLGALLDDSDMFEDQFQKAFSIQPVSPFGRFVYETLKERLEKNKK